MEFLRKIWQAWKRFGKFIGDVIARVVLTAFYFTLFMPFGLGVRFMADPLAIGRSTSKSWLERRTRDVTLKDTRRLS